MILKLENQSDLEQAAQLISWLNRPHVDKVLVSLPWLDKSEQDRSAKAIKYLFNDCGCLWGGPAFLITFASYFSTKFHESGFSWATMGYSFLISAGVAFVAKFLGLGWSRWRLKVWLQRMAFSEENRKTRKI